MKELIEAVRVQSGTDGSDFEQMMLDVSEQVEQVEDLADLSIIAIP